MEWLTTASAMILLVLLRVAIPIAATLIFIKLLKWLDDRWKQEADLEGVKVVQVGIVSCWEIN